MGGRGSGRPKEKPIQPKKVLKSVLPIEKIFNAEEKEIFNNLVEVYLQDFKDDELTSSDMDDILDLAKNRVLEFRLLQSSVDNTDKQMDISAAVERLNKENKKIKENLSARRKDRIEPNKYKGFSIVDLAVAFDEKRREKLLEQVKKNKDEEFLLLKARENYFGNRFDIDVDLNSDKEVVEDGDE